MSMTVLLPICDVDEVSANLTKRALGCLFELIDCDSALELVVLDNASPCQKATIQAECYYHPRITFARLPHNLGIVQGYNYAASLAMGDFLVFCHSDCLVSSRTFDGIRRCFEETDRVGIVVSKLYAPTGELIQAGGFLSRNLDLAWYTKNSEIDIEVDWGDFITIRRTLFECCGGLDELYGKGYMEFPDICCNVKFMGCRVILASDSRVIHYKSQTSHRLFSKIEREHMIRSNLAKFKGKWWSRRASLLSGTTFPRNTLTETELDILTLHNGIPRADPKDFAF